MDRAISKHVVALFWVGRGIAPSVLEIQQTKSADLVVSIRALLFRAVPQHPIA